MRRVLLLTVLIAACTDSSSDFDMDNVTELGTGGPVGKEDSAGVASLPVADYADTAAWTVKNQWEDKDTAAAKAAGIVWPANSGLNWDEKYALWVGSFEKVASHDAWFDTVKISTPFGKSVDGPKIDCADLSLLLRI